MIRVIDFDEPVSDRVSCSLLNLSCIKGGCFFNEGEFEIKVTMTEIAAIAADQNVSLVPGDALVIHGEGFIIKYDVVP